MTQLGLSQQDFASRLQMAPASISSIFNGRTNPTINHVMAIHRAFPQVNERWLLFGEGEMMGTSGQVLPTENAPLPSSVTTPDSGDNSGMIDMGGLFDQNITPPTPTQNTQAPVKERPKTPVIEIAKNIDKPLRRVKEIRVFYDDNTYETFVPAVK